MNVARFIANKIKNAAGGFSAVVHKIAIVTIALGLAATICSFLIMLGFQHNVQNKIFDFSAHIIVNRLTDNNSVEEPPFPFNPLVDSALRHPSIAHVQEFAHKAGLVKRQSELLGILLKGVGKSFDSQRFSSNMVEGRFIAMPDSGYSKDIVLSRHIANKLNANVGDELIVHFFQNPPRNRKLRVSGIYETNLSEYFDGKVILCDLRLIQRLNDWPPNFVGGIQVFLKNNTPEITIEVDQHLADALPFDIYSEPTAKRYFQVFDWLALISRQVNFLLIIILAVVGFNMISVIIILVMERTQMIGLLKAMGSPNAVIRKIFIYQGLSLLSKGLLWGNVVGLGLCWLQHQFKFITLDAQSYYMPYVPVYWHWPTVALLNLATFVVVFAVVIFPAMLVARVNPIQAIKFD